MEHAPINSNLIEKIEPKSDNSLKIENEQENLY